MSLRLVHIASRIEGEDDFHIARLLILLESLSGRNYRPVDGIMKLAKLDFLLRYPNCLVRALEAIGRDDVASEIDLDERNTIEARMIRFRYGPWDSRYRRWIGILVAKDLVHVFLEGRTVRIILSPEGYVIAKKLGERPEFSSLSRHSKLLSAAVGSYSATKLKNFVYDVFPEVVNMKWGDHIEL